MMMAVIKVLNGAYITNSLLDLNSFCMKAPAFDLVAVGAGGGPDETNLSAYVVYSCSRAHVLTGLADISLKSIPLPGRTASLRLRLVRQIAIQKSVQSAEFCLGSGQGALARLLREQPDLFQSDTVVNGTAHQSHTASEIYSFVK